MVFYSIEFSRCIKQSSGECMVFSEVSLDEYRVYFALFVPYCYVIW